MKPLKKAANVLLAFILVFGMCPIAPSAAVAGEGDLTVGTIAGLTTGSSSALSAQADSTVSSWGELKQAIDNAKDSAGATTITLGADIVAGDGDKSLKLEDWQMCTIDLAGHTVNRNLTSQDDDNGHVFDVYRGTLTIKDSSTEKTGTITGGYAKNGGGIVVSGAGHLNFMSGTITGNQAYNGGGIYVYPADGADTGIQLKMTGGQVVGNIGGDCGGVYTNGNAELSDVSITDNSTRGAGGGGLNNKGTATVTNCTISRNVADQGGGGIYNDGNLTMSGCTISDNTSKDNGGGMNTHNTATVTNCTFTSNSAAVDGGAVYSYGCNTTLTGCTLNNNKADASGGAIRAYGGTVELDHTTLNKNVAAWYGGGIYCNNDSTIKLLNSSSITENIGYHGGGGMYVESQVTEVQVGSGVVVKDNQAYTGGGIYVYPADGADTGIQLKMTGGTASSWRNPAIRSYATRITAKLT